MTLADLLPDGMSIEDLLIAMSSISVLVSILAVWFAFLHKDLAAQRARQIATQRRDMRTRVMGPQRREAHKRSMTVMRQVVETLRLLRSAQTNKVALKLTKAGWRTKDALVRFFFAKFALPFLGGGIALFLLYGVDAYPMAPMWKAASALGATLFGAYLSLLTWAIGEPNLLRPIVCHALYDFIAFCWLASIERRREST